MLEQLSHCPVCHHTRLSPFLEGKDYFFSQEEFSIDECNQCGFRFTNPRPPEPETLRYYSADQYISHDSHSMGWFSALYRIIRASSIRGKHQLITRYVKEGNLLDIGCGTGEFLYYCGHKGFGVTGIEPVDKARDQAIRNYHLTVYPDYLEKITEKSAYQVITLWHVLEHIYKLEAVLKKIDEELAPDGILMIALPNSQSQDARYYGRFWAAYDLPRHIYHFTPQSVEMLAQKYGWHICAVHPMKWDAFYISLLSERYRGKRFPYLRALWEGMRSVVHARRVGFGWSSQIYVLSRKKA